MPLAEKLHAALSAAHLPVLGVSIGRPDDRDTWRVDLTVNATDQEKAAAAVLVQSFNPNAIDPEAVNDERLRRIGLTFTATLSAIGAIPIDMTEQSRSNIAGLTTLAIILAGQGVTTPITTFRDAANVDHALTPSQAIALGVQAAQRVDAVYKKSWALKAMNPIPADYTADSYWT